MNQLVAIVGPTGIGKSSLALRLAQRFNGEIVNADSRQVYRYMDIGTAKPSREERALVAHHILDVVNPDEGFSLAEYLRMAYHSIADVQKRERLPLLVGGSGQYVWAVLEGWKTPEVPPDTGFRASMERLAAEKGADFLYSRLAEIDPRAAQRVDPRNVRRVIRALEVHRKSGLPPSHLMGKEPPAFSTMVIGLTVDRKELYRKIDLRVDRMIEQGLVAEVANLLNLGYQPNLPSMSSIGYRQIVGYLKGELNMESAVQQTKFETHRFVRHQYAWFRLSDSRIRWFNMAEHGMADIEDVVSNFWHCQSP